MAVRLSALRTRRTLLPRNIIIFLMLLVLISGRGCKPQGLVRPGGLGKFKNHLIGYRTRGKRWVAVENTQRIEIKQF
jgi:hypothetical protein